jgi:aryl-alcohol dehydrogenase-like predicted oxidoreductase
MAVDNGITLLDLAPDYGRGEAESVVGEAKPSMGNYHTACA